ncbi:MAG: DUF4340 domain-containing protein [Magnetospirillum sp. WYHS-4]
MDRKVFRIVAAVAGLALVLAMAALFLRPSAQESAGAGERLFPTLLDVANQVEMVAIASGRETLTLERKDGRWSLAERHGYPVGADRVRAVVLGLADLRILEAKTKLPEHHKALGVEDSGLKDSTSREVTLFDAKGQKVAAAIVGRPKFDVGGGERGLYIRRAGEDQAWLVKGQVDLGQGSADWLEREIVDVAAERVASIAIRHPDGETLVASRSSADEKHLSVKGVAAKREDILDGMMAGLSHLMLDDVRKADDLEIGDAYLTRAEVTTFDGLTVKLRIGKLLQEYWIWLAAEGNEEAAKLDARLKPWVYRIPSFKAERFLRRTSDIRKAEEEKASGKR